MPQPLIYHIDVNSAFLSWEAAELLRQDPDAPDIRSFRHRRQRKDTARDCSRQVALRSRARRLYRRAARPGKAQVP